MKKSLLAFLLALTATFTLAAIGCKDDDNTDMGNQGNVDNSGDNNSPEEGETFEVTLTAGEGYKLSRTTYPTMRIKTTGQRR